MRAIVIKRDGGCIFQPLFSREGSDNEAGLPYCNGYAKDGHIILQADHLISRSNAATYADTRLIVCVCKGHHGWKSVGSNLRKARYDAIVRQLISPERVKLWNAMEQDSWRPTKVCWPLLLAAVKQELKGMADFAV